MSDTMTGQEREAYNVGRERGWDHANYAEAYDGGFSTMDEPTEIPMRFTGDLAEFFKSGWQEGLNNFDEGLYPDGSPRD